MGIDLTTAIRTFIRMSIEAGGFPFQPRIASNARPVQRDGDVRE